MNSASESCLSFPGIFTPKPTVIITIGMALQKIEVYHATCMLKNIEMY